MNNSEQKPRVYEFGPFLLDTSERVLLRDGKPVMLPPKLFDTLLALVEQSGHIVDKDALMQSVWPDTFVEESNLSSNVSQLRKVLGEGGEGAAYIETIPRRGYRFTAEVAGLIDDADLIVHRRTRTRVVSRIDEDTDKVIERQLPATPIDAIAIATPEALQTRESVFGPTRKFWPLMIAASVLVFAAAIFATLLIRRTMKSSTIQPFAQMKISPVTGSGVASRAVISPDGQYIAHVTGGTGHESLQLRHAATGTDQEIVPADKDNFSAVTFSHDGKFTYYVKYIEKGGGVLFEIPALGGTARAIAKDVDGCASFSPNGKQFAFIRGRPIEGEDALMIARTDDGGERKLLSHRLGETFADASVQAWGPAWSPDGSVIAFALRTTDDKGTDYRRIMLAHVADGTETALTSEKWFSVGQITWLPDGSGLIVAAAEQQQNAPHQLWYVTYPGGAARRITNDLNNYDGVSISTDATMLVTVQSERRANIWVSDAGDEAHASQLPSDKNDGVGGVAWTPDARVVYTSTKNGNIDIWIMNANGGNRKQLTNSDGADFRPTVSADGRYIVFISERTGTLNVWRMDIDGGNPRQLTNQGADYSPTCSPDNQWVIYSSNVTGHRQLYKVPIDGGLPVAITDYAAGLPVVSPDAKFVACSYVAERDGTRRYTTAVVPISGGLPVKLFDFPRSFEQVVRWTPDNRALTYLLTRGGVSNIWRQPLDGGEAKPVTDFKTETVFRYDWSRDGKKLLMARGTVTSDVVLIRDFR